MSYDKEGKVVKKIVGYDANALYLYRLGEKRPCGKLYLKKMITGYSIEKKF